MLEATHSQAQGCLCLDDFLFIYIFFYFTGISGRMYLNSLILLAMLSALDSSSVLCVLSFQPLRCEDPPCHHSLHCPCSTLAKPPSWINPFPFSCIPTLNEQATLEKSHSLLQIGTLQTQSLWAYLSLPHSVPPPLSFHTWLSLHLLPSIFVSHLSIKIFSPCMESWPPHFVSAPLFFQVCSLSAMA